MPMERPPAAAPHGEGSETIAYSTGRRRGPSRAGAGRDLALGPPRASAGIGRITAGQVGPGDRTMLDAIGPAADALAAAVTAGSPPADAARDAARAADAGAQATAADIDAMLARGGVKGMKQAAKAAE